MSPDIILLPICIPLAGALLVMLSGRGMRPFKEAAAVAALGLSLGIAAIIFKKEILYSFSWLGYGIDFSLRLDRLSAFTVLSASVAAFLVSVYSVSFMRERPGSKQFYAWLLVSLSFVNGAALSDNLALMLFFWEGLLFAMFCMISLGGKDSFRTAVKMLIIVGIADICLMFGIALAAKSGGTLAISRMSLEPVSLGALAFVLLFIGALSKAGGMPFHTWIPDAANDAPLPFMAFFPAAAEKILGIYFLSRLCLDMFKLSPEHGVSALLMAVGAVTIILAVMMALIQKDYKRLLSYHAVSQVGYMVLGIGTAVPIGIVGGIFHMINNAVYKSCLFFTGGAVEKEAGSTDLERLGGLMKSMPITFGCFLIAAASISGVPPFNGFFSKELIYDAALERGFIFYLAAAAGTFFTAISFLKLGHAAFGRRKDGQGVRAKDAGWLMSLPMIFLALLCVFFGIFNAFPLKSLIQPAIGERVAGMDFSGWPRSQGLVLASVFVFFLAFLSHFLGAKKTGSGLKAVDYIHHAPLLSSIYGWAEKKYFDPYEIGLKVLSALSRMLFLLDRMFNWLFDNLCVSLAQGLGRQIRSWHNGSYALYLAWAVLGAMMVAFLFARKGL